MDFTKAELPAEVAPVPKACQLCARPLEGHYWTAGPLLVCGNCAKVVEAGPPAEGLAGRIAKAAGLGCGAGLLGAAGYSLLITFAHVEAAIVTIGIGWFVGRAVRNGSGRGGLGYQVLAAGLTYGWCMMAYVPSLVQDMLEAKESLALPVAIVLALFYALALPFMGKLGVLGTLILAFGVWRGFQEPKAMTIAVAGPFQFGATGPAAGLPPAVPPSSGPPPGSSAPPGTG